LCPALLGEFNDAKHKYRHEITRQYMLASGAFIIENPEKAGDTNAMNLAAVESVLKVLVGLLTAFSFRRAFSFPLIFLTLGIIVAALLVGRLYRLRLKRPT
jgi:hypothetical protein